MNELTIAQQKIRLLYDKGEPLRSTALELEAHYRNNYLTGATKFDIGSVQCEIQLEKFMTQDPGMLAMKDLVRKLINLKDPVIITGESGTGKGIVARALHAWRKGKFVHVNCTSLPDELIESELFGHKKGAFTGAIGDRIGKFQEATDGTLFLDEIGDMPLNMQTKLLLALEEGWICPVGGNEQISIDCRVISATNQNIDKIRNDLYWRLSTYEVHLTPLRDRPGDIPLIAQSIDPSFPLQDIQDRACNLGNVRELTQIIKRWKLTL